MGLEGSGAGGTAETIKALRPTFLRHPEAVMHWMVPMRQLYLARFIHEGNFAAAIERG
jgi:hypothetical protein